MTSSAVRYCYPAKYFFHVGEQKIVRWCQIRRVGRGDQPVQSHNHAQQPLQPQTCVQDHCPGETGLPSSAFSRPFTNCLYSTFHSPELLIQCGFIWKRTMQLVSEEFEFNACHISLLRHSSFLVSLWTFQPTLVTCTNFWWLYDIEIMRGPQYPEQYAFHKWRYITIVPLSHHISDNLCDFQGPSYHS